MPQPDFREFYSEELSNFAVAYWQDESKFIASKVFPVVEVERPSATYNVWDADALMRDDMALRPPATESAGSGFKVSQDTYSCLVWSLHKDLDVQGRANWTAKTSTPEQSIARYLVQQGLQRRERQFVSKYMKTGVWGKDVTGVAGVPSTNQFRQWNDALADPVADIKAAKRYVAQTGFEPNTLVVNYDVHDALTEHPDILARITGAATPASPAVVTQQALAAIFEVDRYLVAKAAKRTNAEGGTAANAFIFGKSAMLCYVDPNPGPEVPTAGVTFACTGGDMMGMSMAIAQIPAPLLRAVRHEIEMAWDDKVVASSLGYYFDQAVA